MSHRPFKDRLYAEFASIGKALASAHRLELLDLLGQGERSVDELAQEIGQSLANTSAHLQVQHERDRVVVRVAGGARRVEPRALAGAVRVGESDGPISTEGPFEGLDGEQGLGRIGWKD